MEIIYKIVAFEKYCKQCKYEFTKEEDEPCFNCLINSVNVNSRKPVNFKEKGQLGL